MLKKCMLKNNTKKNKIHQEEGRESDLDCMRRRPRLVPGDNWPLHRTNVQFVCSRIRHMLADLVHRLQTYREIRWEFKSAQYGKTIIRGAPRMLHRLHRQAKSKDMYRFWHKHASISCLPHPSPDCSPSFRTQIHSYTNGKWVPHSAANHRALS